MSYGVYIFARVLQRQFLFSFFPVSFFPHFHFTLYYDLLQSSWLFGVTNPSWTTVCWKKKKYIYICLNLLRCYGFRSPSCLDAVLENLYEHCDDPFLAMARCTRHGFWFHFSKLSILDQWDQFLLSWCDVQTFGTTSVTYKSHFISR